MPACPATITARGSLRPGNGGTWPLARSLQIAHMVRFGSVSAMFALVLVAASVGFSNLAAAVGVGAGGVDHRTRLRVAVIFGGLEAGMPVVGLLIGKGLASRVGGDTRWLAAIMLAAVGIYGIVQAWRSRPGSAGPAAAKEGEPGRQRPSRGGRQSIKLLISGFALSLDNLVAGFALGTFGVGIVVGALVFGLVSVLMSLAGLELGARIGGRSGTGGELVGGVVLIGVGVAIGCGVLG
jgi:manganese efflux pump family protein